ncbi:uncharacterized protein LOC124276320 [Haliotis rubra]|uniref:uncharacterized protein LOC124276320 n=1 Tax=Haliotis rubra TaxID=36100 RepID=UPI001EE58B70|nr:uncharacterized protein LOC124276320 [Haliotis rubra]XP_046567890.1 uncharacterized protein LOC124276320 [Haliotis rubra]XP_046567892.1 uncharacterized protein LOC124276320 [Haliotis rubra]
MLEVLKGRQFQTKQSTLSLTLCSHLQVHERNKSSTSSASTLLVSTADQITACPASPPACRSPGATFNDSDFDDDQNPSNNDCALYVESYPLCRPDPSTQFLMDSCGGDSVVDAPPSSLVDCDEDGSDEDPYDYPLYNIPGFLKKSTNGASCSSRLIQPTLKMVDVTVHPEPTPWKKDRSATIHTECPSSTISPIGDELNDEVKDENVYQELGAVDTDSDVYANGTLLSNVEKARTGERSKWNQEENYEAASKCVSESDVANKGSASLYRT